jgi:hypothetical protein
MKLSTRHSLIRMLFSVSLIANSFILFFLISHFSQLEQLHPLSALSQKWWFGRIYNSSPGLKPFIAIHGIIALFSLSGALSINLMFRRSSSQEIFYFQLFLLCISFLSLRLYSYAIEWHRLPFSYTVNLSRTILFFRFNALLFLLLSGLSVYDSRFQKNDPFFLAALLLSLGLAATIPISDRFIANTLSYLPINERSLFILFLIVKLLIPINFLWFVYQRKTVDYMILTGATILCTVAESLIFYVSFPTFIFGLICLIVGALLFSNRIYKLYLWR